MVLLSRGKPEILIRWWFFPFTGGVNFISCSLQPGNYFEGTRNKIGKCHSFLAKKLVVGMCELTSTKFVKLSGLHHHPALRIRDFKAFHINCKYEEKLIKWVVHQVHSNLTNKWMAFV